MLACCVEVFFHIYVFIFWKLFEIFFLSLSVSNIFLLERKQ